MPPGPGIAVEANRLAADHELVAVAERGAIDDSLLVEIGAVAAFEVFDEESTFGTEHRGMATAHGRHVERHFAIVAAANDRSFAVDGESRGRRTFFNKFQKCHDELIVSIRWTSNAEASRIPSAAPLF